VTFTSTMGAPLSEPESARITDAWASVYHHALAVPAQPDPDQMLNYITDTIMACWEVRRAISDGWYYANKRAFPPERPRAPSKSQGQLAALLSSLDEDQITELLEAVNRGDFK